MSSTISSSVATGVAASQKGLSMQQQLAALHQISVVLSRSLDLEQTLSAMLQSLHEHAQMQFGLVSLFDHNRSALFIQALHGVDPEVILRMSGRRRWRSPGLMRSGEKPT